MTNLWKETLSDLKRWEKKWEDVKWVGTWNFKISKDNFEMLAKKLNYDEGYGWQEVASDLLVVGDNWYLRRNEYDGAEDWEFISMVKEPAETKLVEHLAIHEGHCGNETLAELNKEG